MSVSMRLNFIKSMIRPSHVAIAWRDYFNRNEKLSNDYFHLEAAIKWLRKAQDMAKDGGVSGGYWFDFGWKPPYPETTGYIIPTFLEYFNINKDEELVKRAKKMGDWEISVQLPEGAVRSGMGLGSRPAVFNTGQVIQGWVALYKLTGEEKYLSAAIKAADWLVDKQDGDGKWRIGSYNERPHSYYSRVAWPLFQLADAINEEKYKKAAEKNIYWVLSCAKENGWIDYLEFNEKESPLIHTIAYALEGLAGSVPFLSALEADRAKRLIERAAENIMIKYEVRKKDPYGEPAFLPARFDSQWRPHADYSCLTGNAQMAIVWLMTFELTSDARFVNAALKIIDQLKSTQSLNSDNEGIRGAIAGSYPVWGSYKPYAYPNWATKFFADAIMLQEKTMARINI